MEPSAGCLSIWPRNPTSPRAPNHTRVAEKSERKPPSFPEFEFLSPPNGGPHHLHLHTSCRRFSLVVTMPGGQLTPRRRVRGDRITKRTPRAPRTPARRRRAGATSPTRRSLEEASWQASRSRSPRGRSNRRERASSAFILEEYARPRRDACRRCSARRWALRRQRPCQRHTAVHGNVRARISDSSGERSCRRRATAFLAPASTNTSRTASEVASFPTSSPTCSHKSGVLDPRDVPPT